MTRRLPVLIAAICAVAQSDCAAPVWDQGSDGAPSAVYLTWQGDPTTTMTIHWLSGADETADEVSYATADGFMLTGAGDHRPVPHSPYLVHTVELTGLDPGRDVAFEAHDHAYKRTHPIRNGAVDPSGVLYLGDGGWGVGLRDVHPADRTWYLAKSLKVHSFIVTTIQGNRLEHYAVNELGEVIDRYPE